MEDVVWNTATDLLKDVERNLADVMAEAEHGAALTLLSFVNDLHLLQQTLLKTLTSDKALLNIYKVREDYHTLEPHMHRLDSERSALAHAAGHERILERQRRLLPHCVMVSPDSPLDEVEQFCNEHVLRPSHWRLLFVQTDGKELINKAQAARGFWDHQRIACFRDKGIATLFKLTFG